ncbi:MAG: hypothetical protein K9L22_07270 [Methylococcaceae bacterium]|nr:hypothetical protein [Methylococcaceae bacterium]
MKIALLTSPDQWFIPYAQELAAQLENAVLFFRHEDISEQYSWVFILSYHRIIPKIELSKHQHNFVIHASNLPQGKGWAPLFWQILEGKNEIPFSLIEASEKIDEGIIYQQAILVLTGYELNEELRAKQARLIQQMCRNFIANPQRFENIILPTAEESIYRRRTAKDSKLDIDKSLREQFNLLRIVNNKAYPAFFEIDGQRYTVKIEHDEQS